MSLLPPKRQRNAGSGPDRVGVQTSSPKSCAMSSRATIPVPVSRRGIRTLRAILAKLRPEPVGKPRRRRRCPQRESASVGAIGRLTGELLMNGQWLGRYGGSNSGRLVVDLDDLATHYEGRAFAYDDNYPTFPATFSFIKTPSKASAFEFCLDLLPVNPRTGDPAPSWDQIAALFPPGIAFPKKATVKLSLEEDSQVLGVSWQTDIGTFGSAALRKTRAEEPSEYQARPDVSNWEQFKAYVNSLEHRRYIFRGQRELKRLRTGFHRTGRADLVRFQANDIQTLHRHLSQRTTHIFNLGIPDQNGAFFNLVQHHGYPTSLLDWTYSHMSAHFLPIVTRETQKRWRPARTLKFVFSCSIRSHGGRI